MAIGEDWILVGVDGGSAGEAAVEYAARYAAPRDLGLKLLHVSPEMAATPTCEPEGASTGGMHRRAILDAAAAHARELTVGRGIGRVVTDAAFGGRVDRLLRASADCGFVVLGDQRRPDVDRLATGSVLAGVAARCPVPVIGVPAGWTPHEIDPLVVAGVKHARESDILLRYASQAADAWSGRLQVLQARDARHGAPGHMGALQEAARRRLVDAVAAHRCDDGRAPVDVDVVCGQPARVLVDVSAHADLIILTRRPLVYPHGYLGGTGRAVLRESRCPVAVLPPPLPRASARDATWREREA